VVQHGGQHGRRGARRAGVWWDAVLGAALRCAAVLLDAVGSSREQHRRSRRWHGSVQLLSRSCLLTRLRSPHALEQGCCALPCAWQMHVAGRSACVCQLRVAICVGTQRVRPHAAVFDEKSYAVEGPTLYVVHLYVYQSRTMNNHVSGSCIIKLKARLFKKQLDKTHDDHDQTPQTK
jgi:hypothetical protein